MVLTKVRWLSNCSPSVLRTYKSSNCRPNGLRTYKLVTEMVDIVWSFRNTPSVTGLGKETVEYRSETINGRLTVRSETGPHYFPVDKVVVLQSRKAVRSGHWVVRRVDPVHLPRPSQPSCLCPSSYTVFSVSSSRFGLESAVTGRRRRLGEGVVLHFVAPFHCFSL